MGRVPQADRSRAARAADDAQIIRLSREGKTVRQIAEVIGKSHATVHRRLTAALRAEVLPEIESLRDVEGSRLEALWSSLQPGIADGDPRTISVAVRVSERRSRLFGLDAPESVDIQHHAQVELSAELVVTALGEALSAMVAAAGLPAAQAALLGDYGREVAQWALGGREGDRPEAPVVEHESAEPWPYAGAVPSGAERAPVAGELLPVPSRWRTARDRAAALEILEGEVSEFEDVWGEIDE